MSDSAVTNKEKKAANRAAGDDKDATDEYVSMLIGDQWFGIPVLGVQEVLGPQKIARIPLAPGEVAGNLNLRGRIATAIDIRTRLGMTPRPQGQSQMSVVVDHRGELYSLVIDTVGEVVKLSAADFEHNPPTIKPRLRELSKGIYRLSDKLLVVLDVERVLDSGSEAHAA
ncbi:MAG: chemotaxis protein CheW [Alphaproteobacteria bacterium]